MFIKNKFKHLKWQQGQLFDEISDTQKNWQIIHCTLDQLNLVCQSQLKSDINQKDDNSMCKEEHFEIEEVWNKSTKKLANQAQDTTGLFVIDH